MKNLYENLITEKDIKLEETLEHLEEIQKNQRFIESTEFLQNLVSDLFELRHQLKEESGRFNNSESNEYDTVKIIYSRALDGIDLIVNKYNLTEDIGCNICNQLLNEKLSEIVNNFSYHSDDSDSLIEDFDED